MTMERHLLSWDQPCLAAAAEFLLNRPTQSPGVTDLRDLIVALPGSRAGRRLLELLLERSEKIGRRLVPPRILTVGSLFDELITPDESAHPVASCLARRLAWVAAMRRIDAEHLAAVVPQPPPPEDRLAWFGLADQLDSLHTELAGDELDFDQVAAQCETALDFSFKDSARWRALAEIQRQYLQILVAAGLDDPQRSHRRAIDQKRLRQAAEVVVVGAADMNALQRRLLRSIPGKLSLLVHADLSQADLFDDLGCLRVQAWAQAPIHIPEQVIQIVDRPADQAAQVIREIAALEGRFAADQITVGVADDQIAPYLQQVMPEFDLPVRDAAGIALRRTPVIQALLAAADWLDHHRFADLAALVRHPDVERWLLDHASDPAWIEDWPSLMDAYYAHTLQTRITGDWLGNPERCEGMKRVHDSVIALMGSLAGPPCSIGQWAAPIADLLAKLYGSAPIDRRVPHHRITIQAIDSIRQALIQLANLPSSLVAKTSAGEAIRLLVHEVGRQSIPPEPDAAAIELLGPLEWQMDDAPVLIATGFNDGKLPSALNADPFLPDGMRRHLGILSNTRRYARDSYLLGAVIASRPYLRLIAGRRSAEGDPLQPSRLLFACDDRRLTGRIARFFPSREEDRRPAARLTSLTPRSRSDLPRPRLPIRPFDDSMRVTEFADYLACPYRYYLRHVLRLCSADDRALELDALQFGSLAHDVLKYFGDSPLRDSEDGGQIAQALSQELDRRAGGKFGSGPPVEVLLQIEQLRRRLSAFADRQAERYRQGWRIRHVETGCDRDDPALFDVDGRPLRLRGRIDRIDFHPELGWAILDYKTSETPKRPEDSHRDSSKAWIDLQLPLYRHLVGHLKLTDAAPDQPVALGYIHLPKDVAKIDFELAGWTQDDLRSADEQARSVVRRIRSGDFELEEERFSRFEEFDSLCQLNRLASADDPEQDPEDPA